MASNSLVYTIFPGSISLLVLIIFAFSRPAQAASNHAHPHGHKLIIDMCKTTHNYTDLCIASLGSNPASHDATRPDLVRISVGQVIANVTAIRAHIRKLQSKTHDPNKAESFRACYEDYSVALRELRLAFKHFKTRSYGLVLENLMMVETVASDCEMEFKMGSHEGYKKKHHVSLPLTNMNVVAIQLSRVAFSLLSSMTNKRA